MIDYRFSDDFPFLLVPASPRIGPFETHHNEWNADATTKQARGYLNAFHAQFPGDVQLGADLGATSG